MKSTSEQPAHFAVTKFNCAPIRELAKRHVDLVTELREVNEFGETTKRELATATRKTSFKDKLAMDALAFKRLQFEMVPHKIEDMETEIATVEDEIKKQVDGLLPKVIGDLECHEKKLVRTAMMKKLRSHYEHEWQAENATNASLDMAEIASKFYWYSSFVPPMENLAKALKILDSWTEPKATEETFTTFRAAK